MAYGSIYDTSSLGSEDGARRGMKKTKYR